MGSRRSGDGDQWHYHPDHLGSPRVLSDRFGNYESEHHYYPYGTEYYPFGSPRPDDFSYKFTGHERDANGVTDYMLGRTYFFPLGRFASVDPARDGWNLYGYVGGSPMVAVDPSGRETVVITVTGSNIAENRKGVFGHAALVVRTADGQTYADFGGADRLRSGLDDFINGYLAEGRRVNLTVLDTTPEEDARIAAFLERTHGQGTTERYDALSQNCTTAVCNSLREGGVIEQEENPGRVFGVDIPEILQFSLEKGTLRERTAIIFVFDPRMIKSTYSEQVDYILDNYEKFIKE